MSCEPGVSDWLKVLLVHNRLSDEITERGSERSLPCTVNDLSLVKKITENRCREALQFSIVLVVPVELDDLQWSVPEHGVV